MGPVGGMGSVMIAEWATRASVSITLKASSQDTHPLVHTSKVRHCIQRVHRIHIQVRPATQMEVIHSTVRRTIGIQLYPEEDQ